MVLMFDGNSKICAHVRNNLCYLICLRHLISSRAVQPAAKSSQLEGLICALYFAYRLVNILLFWFGIAGVRRVTGLVEWSFKGYRVGWLRMRAD